MRRKGRRHRNGEGPVSGLCKRKGQRACHINPETTTPRQGCTMGQERRQSGVTCVTSSRGITQVSPPAVKLQKTRKASRAQPWLGSTQYSPVG